MSPDEPASPEELARVLRLALDSTAELEEDLEMAFALGDLDEEEYRALKAEMEKSKAELLDALQGEDESEP